MKRMKKLKTTKKTSKLNSHAMGYSSNKKETSEDFLKSNANKLVKDLPIDKYHGMPNTWSSSQFKDILDDEEHFIKKYIKKEIPREEREAFDTGTYFHTAVLEPHKVKSEIAVFPGKTRYGKEWDRFKAKNNGKIIISSRQKEQGDRMIEAVKDSPVAQDFLDGNPEVSLFVRLLICYGNIYAPKFKKVLGSSGWVDVNECPTKGFEINVKVRADMLGDEYISDLKSTSGNARSESGIRSTISRYKYDLSAALYLDMFSLVKPNVKEFVWIFASKDLSSAASYRATQNQILVGRAKYTKGMRKMADCAQAKWELVDYLRDIEPLPHEMEWLQTKDTDLL